MWDTWINRDKFMQNLEERLGETYYCYIDPDKEHVVDGLWTVAKNEYGYYLKRTNNNLLINQADIGAFRQFVKVD